MSHWIPGLRTGMLKCTNGSRVTRLLSSLSRSADQTCDGCRVRISYILAPGFQAVTLQTNFMRTFLHLIIAIWPKVLPLLYRDYVICSSSYLHAGARRCLYKSALGPAKGPGDDLSNITRAGAVIRRREWHSAARATGSAEKDTWRK